MCDTMAGGATGIQGGGEIVRDGRGYRASSSLGFGTGVGETVSGLELELVWGKWKDWTREAARLRSVRAAAYSFQRPAPRASVVPCYNKSMTSR